MATPTGPVAAAAAARSALLGTYAPPDLVFVEGRGSWLVDGEGRRCLDFTSGIGVNALGHGHPVVVRAIRDALDTGLVHTSNLFRTEPAERLAQELVEASFPGRVFFCNSGAEAVEGAFKIARRWARESGGPGKHGIVAFRGSFHGRLFASLAATDRPGYRAPFEPLVPGVRFADLDDPGSWDRAVTAEETAAVIVEPVQGEGGVRPVSPAALGALRGLCDQRGAALVFDEVQCGLGRTGRMFAFQHAGVRPDLLALAKPLGGGLPMGAVVAGPALADAMEPGDHATTFGGGPLVASVARAVLATLGREGFLEGVRERGDRLSRGLRALGSDRDVVVDVRGLGLMWGMQLARPAAADIVSKAREAGLLLTSAGPEVVRFLPPLTVSEDEVDLALERLAGALP